METEQKAEAQNPADAPTESQLRAEIAEKAGEIAALKKGLGGPEGPAPEGEEEKGGQ